MCTGKPTDISLTYWLISLSPHYFDFPSTCTIHFGTLYRNGLTEAERHAQNNQTTFIQLLFPKHARIVHKAQNDGFVFSSDRHTHTDRQSLRLQKQTYSIRLSFFVLPWRSMSVCKMSWTVIRIPASSMSDILSKGCKNSGGNALDIMTVLYLVATCKKHIKID